MHILRGKQALCQNLLQTHQQVCPVSRRAAAKSTEHGSPGRTFIPHNGTVAGGNYFSIGFEILSPGEVAEDIAANDFDGQAKAKKADS